MRSNACLPVRSALLQSQWMLVACLLVVGLTPRAARAEEDFDRYLSAAAQLFESLEYEDALEQVQRAKQLARGVKQDVAVALVEGIILAELGKKEPSQAAFRRGLSLELEAKLPLQVSPKVERSFDEVRASVRRARERSVRARPEPLPSLPVAAAPAAEETKPAKVVEADRPERAPEPPKLKEPVLPPSADYVPAGKVRGRSRVPVVPLVLAGAGVAAAGVGTWFGVRSRSSVKGVSAEFANGFPQRVQLPAVYARLDEARGQARMANVFFATAGAAVTGALVTYLLSGDDTKPASKEVP